MQRNYLATMVAVVVVLSVVTAGAFVAFGSAGAQDVDDQSEPPADKQIHVSATGSAENAPDEALIRVTVTAEGDEIGPVRDELANGSTALRSVLDELDVTYETSEYDISEQRFRSDERDGPAYRGVHTYEVQIDDPDRIGAVIDAAAGAGAEVGNVQLTLSEDQREQLRDEAIEDAMADARQQAGTISETSDLTVTGVSSVDATQQQFRPVSFDSVRALQAETDGNAPPTDISTGDVSVTYTVSVTYNASS